MSITSDATIERVEGSFLGQPEDDLFLAVREIAENIGRTEVTTSFTYRLLQRLDMLAGGGRVVDLIRKVVSLLASETILERRREPTYSLLCWYCTRLRRESPEIDAKSVCCD